MKIKVLTKNKLQYIHSLIIGIFTAMIYVNFALLERSDYVFYASNINTVIPFSFQTYCFTDSELLCITLSITQPLFENLYLVPYVLLSMISYAWIPKLNLPRIIMSSTIIWGMIYSQFQPLKMAYSIIFFSIYLFIRSKEPNKKKQSHNWIKLVFLAILTCLYHWAALLPFAIYELLTPLLVGLAKFLKTLRVNKNKLSYLAALTIFLAISPLFFNYTYIIGKIVIYYNLIVYLGYFQYSLFRVIMLTTALTVIWYAIYKFIQKESISYNKKIILFSFPLTMIFGLLGAEINRIFWYFLPSFIGIISENFSLKKIRLIHILIFVISVQRIIYFYFIEK